MLLEALRIKVLEAARDLKRLGLVWMAGGTICARDPESGLVVVTPSGMPYEDLTPKDIVITDMDLHVVEGALRPSVAMGLWTGIFRARNDVNALVHTHSVYATAFSVAFAPIPVATETMADWFDRPIQVAPYAHVEDPEFITGPIAALGKGQAVLLGKHGPITVGKNLEHAMERAVTLEEAAKTYTMARLLGIPQVFSESENLRSYEFYHNRYGQREES
ncbi:hypothetical protein EG834_13970 [bacterium]|nr:hypothetical protein [bacterium]